MVSHSGLITVMTRAARKAAPRLQARFRRSRAASGQPQGSGRLRLDGRRARRGDPRRGVAPRTARLGVSARGGRRASPAIPPSRAGWSIRSTAPPTSSTAFPISRCRSRSRSRSPAGRAGASSATASSISRSPTRASGRRRGGAPGSTTARLRVSARPRPQRGAGRDRHAVQGSWRSRPLPEGPRCGRARGRRHPPLRLGRARSRLGRRRTSTTASGRRISTCGTSPPALSGARGGRLRHRLSRRRCGPREGEVLAADDPLHSKLHKLLAGALR